MTPRNHFFLSYTLAQWGGAILAATCLAAFALTFHAL